MTQKTELPALPEPRLWYDPETQRCSSMAPLRPTYISLWDEDDLRAYATAAVLTERERFVSRLRHEMDLDGFGCACEPTLKCGTCKARDVLQKALGPLVKELAPPPKEPT